MRTPSRPAASSSGTHSCPTLEAMLRAIDKLAEPLALIGRRDKYLADQLRRAATSVALNLAEANGSDPGNRRARLFTALGSLRETRAALRIAVAWRYVAAHEALDEELDRVARLTYRRLHPR